MTEPFVRTGAAAQGDRQVRSDDSPSPVDTSRRRPAAGPPHGAVRADRAVAGAVPAGESPIMLLMTSAQEAESLRETLRGIEGEIVVCREVGDLCGRLTEQVGCLLIAGEQPADPLAELESFRASHPQYQSLPIIVIADEPAAAAPVVAPNYSPTVLRLERPVSPTTLVSAVRFARRMHAHARQLEGDLARRERALQRASAEMDEFATIISHDLRSPLLSMTGCVSLLVEQSKGQVGPEGDELIGFINGSARRLNEMLKSLLEYSRVGSRELCITECSLEEALQKAMDSLPVELKAAGAHITHDPLPVVRADRARMAQLLGHLLDNAVKFHGDGKPEVHLTAQAGPREWIVCVRDRGIGIAPDQADRIFKVFHRLHSEDSHYKGTGIGLAICRKIVERHGGRIWVESEAGPGSTFRFTLPQ